MKKSTQFAQLVHLTIIALFLAGPLQSINAQDKGTFKDSRDGHVYQWVKIGKKNWMAENLKFSTASGSYVYNNDTANLSAYGRLYEHATALTSCPNGWRLPTDDDWAVLIAKLGGPEVAGEKLQAYDTLYRAAHPNLTEQQKTLSYLLGGVRHTDNTYSGIGQWGGLWSATVTADGVSNYLFAHGDKSISKSTNDKTTAFGVRCVKK